MTEYPGVPREPIPRSPGVSATTILGWLMLLAVLQVLHVALRDKLWMPDVPRAINAYLFSMVLFAPAVAGFGAAAGVSFARSVWLLRGHPRRGAIRFFAVPSLSAIAIFLAGQLVVIAIAMSDGAPLSFGDGRGIDVGIALVALLGMFAVGAAIGARWPSRVTPPAMLLGAFGLTLLAWNGGAQAAIEFGGGPTDGVGASYASQALRLVLFGALLVIGWQVLSGMLRSAADMKVRVIAGVVAVGAVTVSAVLPADMVYAQQDIRAECTGDAFLWCVSSRAIRYRDRLLDLSEAPIVEKAFSLVLQVPAANPGLVWEPYPYQFVDWDAPREVQRAAVARTVLVAMLPPFCHRDDDIFQLGEPRSSAALLFQIWVSAAVGEPGADRLLEGFVGRDLPVPDRLLPPPRPALDGPSVVAWLNEYAALFEPCRPQGRVPDGWPRSGPPSIPNRSGALTPLPRTGG